MRSKLSVSKFITTIGLKIFEFFFFELMLNIYFKNQESKKKKSDYLYNRINHMSTQIIRAEPYKSQQILSKIA